MGEKMKDFITSIAAVLILMMFVMQFAANQSSFTKIMSAEYAIREMRLISEKQGIIKSESITELKAELADILGCSVSEIETNIADTGGEITNTETEPVSLAFNVSMPVYGVIGPAGIMGISASENVRIHRSDGVIVLAAKEKTESGADTSESFEENSES